MNAFALLGFFVSTIDQPPAQTPAPTPPPTIDQPPAQAPAPPAPSIWERLSLYAEGRLRGESTFDQPTGDDRHRGRMRFRAGGIYRIEPDLKFEGRFSTAAPGGDANNPYWDFGDGTDGFSGSDVVLDRFYLDWTRFDGLSLRAGKQPHVFASPPVFSEFVWDADIQPAGVGAVWTSGTPESKAKFDARAVGYVAVENGADDDAAMVGLQLNAQVKTGDSVTLQGSASYSSWSSLDPNAGAFANQGNTDVTGDFGIVEGFVAAIFEGGPLGRTTGFVELMHNAEDDDDESDGFALGAQLGKSGKKGDTNFFGVWYDLDANAVFSPVAQDDTPINGTGIGTGMQGVIAGGQYFFTDNLSIRVWGLSSDADADDDPYRARIDIDFKLK